MVKISVVYLIGKGEIPIHYKTWANCLQHFFKIKTNTELSFYSDQIPNQYLNSRDLTFSTILFLQMDTISQEIRDPCIANMNLHFGYAYFVWKPQGYIWLRYLILSLLHLCVQQLDATIYGSVILLDLTTQSKLLHFFLYTEF